MILKYIADHGETSPREYSMDVMEDLSRISYHFRQLLQHRLIYVVRRERVRAAVETWYDLDQRLQS